MTVTLVCGFESDDAKTSAPAPWAIELIKVIWTIQPPPEFATAPNPPVFVAINVLLRRVADWEYGPLSTMRAP